MKILFLNLPYQFEISRASRWPEKTKSGTLYYPYWLCCAAGVCLDRGHDVSLVDCIARKYTPEQTVELVRATAPDFLMAELTTPTCFYDYEVLRAIKAACPSVRILVGGTHATALHEAVLRECEAIDAVARQEYDFTVAEILNAGGDFSGIPGLTCRRDGQIEAHPDRPWTDDLDKIPFVSKIYERFLDVNDYFYSFAQKPMIQIYSARGCPFRCNFCSYPETLSGRRFRKRSVKNFVDELSYICTQMPYIREIFIEDDTFTVDRSRVLEICGEIRARGIDIPWSCNTRADLPSEVMKAMREAGCRLMVVGFESGNQRVLDEASKGIRLEDSIAFMCNAKKLGIKVFGCFMIGLKGETLETIEETFRFAKKLAPEMVFFQQAVPFPGTAFYRWAKEIGYLKTEDYSKWLNPYGYLDCLLDYPYAGSKEIEKIRDRLMSRYYFSLPYLTRTVLKNLNRQELKRMLQASVSYLRFKWQKRAI